MLATDTWTGMGANANWSNPANWSNGVPNAGDDLQFVSSFSTFPSAINDLAPGTMFHSFSFTWGSPRIGPPPYYDFIYPTGLPTLTGNAIVLTGGIQVGHSPNGVDFLNPDFQLSGFTLGATQTFSGNFGIDGPFDLNGFNLGCTAESQGGGGGTTFGGPVTASGGIAGDAELLGQTTLSGPCFFASSSIMILNSVDLNGFSLTLGGGGQNRGVVTGNGSIIMNGGPWSIVLNNYTGPTIVHPGGDLIVIGTLSGPVNMDGGAIDVYGTVLGDVSLNGDRIVGGTFGAAGTIVGQVTITRGTLDVLVGGAGTGPPSLTMGPLTLDSSDQFGVHLNGPAPGASYSQVRVNGAVDLGGATFNLAVLFTPSSPSAFVLLESSGSITGTFNGLPEGASVSDANGQTYQIHYFQPSGSFPGRVVLANDSRVTYTSATSSQLTTTSLNPPTLTATVSNVGASPVNGAAPAATGTVTFMDGSTPLSGPIPLVNGVATFAPLMLGGNRSITAVYTSSNSTLLASTSAALHEHVTAVDMGWRDVMRGDFTGDGKQDIIGRSSAGQWWVGVSNGSGFINQLWATWYEAAGWQDVVVGDFNGDGKADIAGRTASGDWWVGLSTGSSFVTTQWGNWYPGVTWVDVKVGAFTGNGKADIAGRVSQSGDWWVAQSTGSSFTNNLWTTWYAGVTWVDVHVGDFTGTGRASIAGRVLESGQWWVAQSTGSSFSNSLWTTWAPGVTWVDVQVGDFTGDGKADIAGRVLESGQWWVAQSTGSSFSNFLWTTWAPNVTWVDVRVGDFTGDGKADIVGRVLESGQWWVGQSTGSSFTNNLWATWAPSITWVDAQTGDLDGNGSADLTARDAATGAWWTGLSTGTAFSTTLWTIWPA